VSRSCARPGCGGVAVATLSYAYGESVVWLDDLAAEGHPMIHDLCSLHAASVRVPRGWHLSDRRVAEPAAGSGGGAGGLRLVGA
jgi:hypothetical protein